MDAALMEKRWRANVTIQIRVTEFENVTCLYEMVLIVVKDRQNFHVTFKYLAGLQDL
jgi:hypothetical protein